jgi:hypothetical protein
MMVIRPDPESTTLIFSLQKFVCLKPNLYRILLKQALQKATDKH